MKLEADCAGVFHSEAWNRDYPRLQLLSIKELLDGRKASKLMTSRSDQPR